MDRCREGERWSGGEMERGLTVERRCELERWRCGMRLRGGGVEQWSAGEVRGERCREGEWWSVGKVAGCSI